jgi:hypothetical protein
MTNTYIKYNEGDHEANVSPSVGIRDSKRKLEEFIRGPCGAKLAGCRCFGINKIASSHRYIVLHVGTTSEAGWWNDSGKFDRRASNVSMANC